MYGLFIFVVSLLCVAEGVHEAPVHESTEFHKGVCNKYEKFIVDLAFNRTNDGTVLIIGAHNHDNDLWGHLKAAKGLDKVFVEPLIPSLFHDFQTDMSALTNVQVVDAAVTGTDSDSATIYCTGSSHPEHVVFKDGAGKSSSSVGTNIVQTCSLDQDRLFLIHDLDVGGNLEQVKQEVIKHMSSHSVKTFSLDTLLAKYVKTPLRMLQIDVEGVDDKIVLDIPLENMEIKPHVIIFEHVLLNQVDFRKAMSHLHDNFYITCGFHHNIFAYNVQWMQGLDGVDFAMLDE